MLSIFIGAFITGTIHPVMKVLYACLSGGMIATAANAINDFYDIEIDRINKPHRPIAAGAIRPADAFRFSIILFLIGVGLGYLVNWKALVVSGLSALLLFYYSFRLKRTVLWGNLAVSLTTALAFIYGGIAVDRMSYALIPAAFSFFYHLGREIIKDIEDVKGDRADHIVTLPIAHGEKLALRLATAIYLLLIGLTFLPYLFQIFGIYYLLIVLMVVDGVILYVLFSAWRNPDAKNLSRLNLILKLNMFAGLIAIYLGKY
ncbi:MAG: geranylgeranylglycerol-phosphate geranylgeranyltransferase [bacterium]|nr:geranylgeranylglycerol-phosphate geranylgeranyltransferase [bacterium]